MMKIAEIEKLEKQYSNVCDKLSKLNEFGNTRKTYVRYKQKEIEFRKNIHQLLAPILEENNSEFKRIASQNHELLKNLNFKLKTRTIGSSLFGYFSTELKGEINPNGVAYCKTKKTNFSIFDSFSSYKIPSKFQGKIDCLGNILLETVSVKSAFLKTLPSSFIGNIENNGKDIIVETNDSEYDLTMSGKLIIFEIVGNPFGKQNNKKDLFFSNKKKLEQILEEYRSKKKKNYR